LVGLRALRAAGPPGHHRVAAVRAHLLERAGSIEAAREEYRTAAKLTLSLPERRYLESRAAKLS
ncbi:MAG TPA: RNA polymerase sigma factor, partial [Actinoplanes sp.]|nr:RNA polymerase sigma factor [Actinoplanes sp.]